MKTRRYELVVYEHGRIVSVMVDRDKGRVLRAQRATRRAMPEVNTMVYPVLDHQNGIYTYGSSECKPQGTVTVAEISRGPGPSNTKTITESDTVNIVR